MEEEAVAERDYVLGTEEDEIERLGLQHQVWRMRMLDAWSRAGIGEGQTVVDVGAGPGYAALDLAEIVGPSGRVIAVERSRRFLRTLSARAALHGLTQVETLERDVVEQGFGEAVADAAWCRWVLCFVPEPRRALANIVRALRPGGVVVFHEYADYGAWQMMPPNRDQERFRSLVMKSWRDAGGEPDIGLHLPGWLPAEGMEIIEIRPLIDVVGPDDFTWQWPAAFMAVNARRLYDLGYASEEQAGRMGSLLDSPASDARMITPLVAEIVARRR